METVDYVSMETKDYVCIATGTLSGYELLLYACPDWIMPVWKLWIMSVWLLRIMSVGNWYTFRACITIICYRAGFHMP